MLPELEAHAIALYDHARRHERSRQGIDPAVESIDEFCG